MLAYQGFSIPLESLKRSLNSIESLPKENPGSRCRISFEISLLAEFPSMTLTFGPSRWPKTSLGCLKEGIRLTPVHLEILSRICR